MTPEEAIPEPTSAPVAESIVNGTVGDLTPAVIGALADEASAVIDALRAELAAAQAKLTDVILLQAIRDTAQRHGVNPLAFGDVERRALSEGWQLDSNFQPVFQPTLSVAGVLPRAGNAAAVPATLDDWFFQLSKVAPYLFLPSTGGGAGGMRYDRSKLTSGDALTLGANLEAIARGDITVIA